MPRTTIRARRDRFEREGEDLDALVHLRMLGQGYDHPPITVVVPMRPYGSFGEFYQFLGRGVRAIRGRDGGHEAAPSEQVLDIVFHAELMLEEHFQSLQREDFDPLPGTSEDELTREDVDGSGSPLLTVIHSPNVVVVQESGVVVSHPVHDVGLHAKRQDEREREALAQQYARYAQANLNPVPFEQFVRVMRSLRG
jgi:superfamily II DNA or RNA helicase